MENECKAGDNNSSSQVSEGSADELSLDEGGKSDAEEAFGFLKHAETETYGSASDESKKNDGEHVSSSDENLEADAESIYVVKEKLIRAEKSIPFNAYKPTVSFGPPHPQELCEGSSLACMELPALTYKLRMKKKYYCEGENNQLSAAQVEGVAYACQSFESGIIINGVSYRQGFLLGDGTGTGKGRIIAGIIKESFRARRKVAVWMTPSRKLFGPATDDIRRFVPEAQIQSIESAFGKPLSSGVLLCTYKLAGRSENQSKILELLGSNYDGLIVFDEAHTAKAGMMSQIGAFIIKLQYFYPDARIVYSSATGASKVEHLRYMCRLGLWSDNGYYKTAECLIKGLSKKGITVLEMLAMDMKKRGVFISRNISFSGVLIKTTQGEPSNAFKLVYRRATHMWLILNCFLRRNKKRLPRNAFAGFFASVLQFFSSLLMTSKIEGIVEQTINAIKEEKSVVIGLQNTGDAVFKRFLEKPFNKGLPFSNCGEILRQFLKFIGIHVGCPKVFTTVLPKPIHLGNWKPEEENQEITSSAEEEISYENLTGFAEDEDDDNGDDNDKENFSVEMLQEIVQDEHLIFAEYLPYSVGMRSYKIESKDLTWSINAACETLSAEGIKRLFHELYQLLPINPLDELNARLNEGMQNSNTSDSVIANCTGKGNWYVFEEVKNDLYKTGLWKVVKCPTEIDPVDLFMDMEKRICVVSDATSVGISLHSDPKRKNSQQRVHITWQTPYSPEKLLQQLGRTHRSNEVYPPEYILTNSGFQGEVRFQAILANRLEKLGAICEGHGDYYIIKGEMNSEFCTDLALEVSYDAVDKLKQSDDRFTFIWSLIGSTKPKRRKSPDDNFLGKLSKFFNRTLLMDFELQSQLILALGSEILRRVNDDEELAEEFIEEYPLKNHDMVRLNVESFDSVRGKSTIHHFRLCRVLTWAALEKKLEALENVDYFEDDSKLLVGARFRGDTGNICYYPYTREAIERTEGYMKRTRILFKYQAMNRWQVLEEQMLTKPGCIHVFSDYNCSKYPCNLCYGCRDLYVLCGPLYNLLPKVGNLFSDGLKLAIVKVTTNDEIEQVFGIIVKDYKINTLRIILKELEKDGQEIE